MRPELRGPPKNTPPGSQRHDGLARPGAPDPLSAPRPALPTAPPEFLSQPPASQASSRLL